MPCAVVADGDGADGVGRSVKEIKEISITDGDRQEGR
jgi:hypothetical protein